MLFDLRGRRRRAVQATYLMLAVLMGGGLVLFGIGGDVSGGLFDAIGGNSTGGGGNGQLEKRIERQQEELKSSPGNEAALAELVRLNYQVAASQVPSGTSKVPEEGQDDLRKAGAYWERYVKAKQGEPDAGLARIALFVYNEDGLNQPDKAKEAVRVLAAQANDTQTYLLLVRYATAAGDKRTAQLAAQKAIDLAPKDQRKQVEKVAKQMQTPAPQQQ
ncbi:MAG: hypothetical protein QOD71_606 [Thermoleophilaceae bacterium]|jgi:hypothetical protein|nr:hypothetical protein [Thermoleophilaceae bacterium]